MQTYKAIRAITNSQQFGTIRRAAFIGCRCHTSLLHIEGRKLVIFTVGLNKRFIYFAKWQLPGITMPWGFLSHKNLWPVQPYCCVPMPAPFTSKRLRGRWCQEVLESEAHFLYCKPNKISCVNHLFYCDIWSQNFCEAQNYAELMHTHPDAILIVDINEFGTCWIPQYGYGGKFKFPSRLADIICVCTAQSGLTGPDGAV